MFPYCRNNPVSRKDASGTDDVAVRDFNQDNNIFNDLGHPTGGSSHGSGAVALGIVSAGSTLAVLSSTGALPNAVSWFEELLKQGERALSEAIALRAKIGFFQGAVTGQKTRFLGLAIDRTASLYSKKV